MPAPVRNRPAAKNKVAHLAILCALGLVAISLMGLAVHILAPDNSSTSHYSAHMSPVPPGATLRPFFVINMAATNSGNSMKFTCVGVKIGHTAYYVESRVLTSD